MVVEVNTEIDNQIAVFTLSREKALNSLTHNMIKTIHRDAYAWSKKPEIAFILFPCLGQKVYCAGGDIRWLYEQGKAGNHERQMAFFADEYRLDYAIGQFSKPVVAIIDGFLMGGGMGLLMPATNKFATEKAVFSMPETGIGFFPDVGMSYWLNQCPGHCGLYLTLTGQRINAYEACHLGLVEGVLSDEEAQHIQSMARQNPEDSRLYEITIDELRNKADTTGETPITDHIEHIDEVFSGESVEAIIEKLSSMSGTWAQQTLKQLQHACPLSLRVTFDLMRKTQNCDPTYSYQLDYAVAYHFMRSQDFYEGVRAQVIDKDRKPQWQFKQISDVPQSVVDDFLVFPENPLDLTCQPNSLESEILTN